jgi:hypothetical protein
MPRTPFEDAHLRAASLGLLSRIGLDLMLAGLHHHDQAHAGRGGVAEGHRRTGPGVDSAIEGLEGDGGQLRVADWRPAASAR